MNWARGLFRVWLLASGAWLLSIGYFAFDVFSKPAPFYGEYQYVSQFKEMPSNLAKPYYESFYPPQKGKFPDEFTTVDAQYVSQWDEGVEDGTLTVESFPDSSRLFLRFDLTKDDRALLSKIFWEKRWARYGLKILPWLAYGLCHPYPCFWQPLRLHG